MCAGGTSARTVTPPACGLDTLGLTGAAAQKLNEQEEQKVAIPADEQDVAKAWETWRAKQHFTGNSAIPDYAHPEQMNRWTWYQTHNWSKPYPGDTKIYKPSEVPAGYLPSSENDG